MALLTYITTFALIILAELGDKTQVATLVFASNNPRKKWQVLLASVLALTLCVTIEVTVGLWLAKYISPSVINKFSGIVFLCLGLYIFYTIFKDTINMRFEKTKPIISPANDNTDKKEILQN